MIDITDFIPVGIEKAVSQLELSVMIRADERTVRQLIHNARRSGAVICSSCDTEKGGYYIPRDPSEAVPYYKQQLARINSATAALRSIIDYMGDEADE